MSNNFAFLIVILVITFVMYKVASGQPITENFWGTSGIKMISKVDRVCDGQSNNNNNQESLTYNQNSIINPSLLSPDQLSALSSSLGGNLNLSNAGNTNNKSRSEINNYSFNTTLSENYESPKSEIPVFTVPGTYQADLSPRFNSNGLNSYVKYNLPQEQNLASYANDPLTMKHRPQTENYEPLDLVNMVEKPKIREDYQSCQSASNKEYNDLSQKLAQQGNDVVNKLPVQPMNASQGGQDNTVYQCADRYIFALQKSKLYGLADPIRGDIPVIPCNPNRNPSSNTWFRPSVNPRVDLNAGALGVIAGGSTNQQLLELMANSAGGSQPVINGNIVNPQTTANTAYNTEMLQKAQYQSLNMGNQINQKVDNIPAAGVYATAFP